jgi:transposase
MKGRVFTADFKLKIVRQVLAGEKTVVQLCHEHNLSDSLIHNWKKLYPEKGELRNHGASLERFIGKQTVELSILKKASELLSTMSKNGVKLTNVLSS